MTIRAAIKNVLYSVCPVLGKKCSSVWDAFAPVVRGKMGVRGITKYILRGVVLGGRFTYFGTEIYFPRAAACFRLICKDGIYEPEVTAWLCQMARPNELFIDVGSNIGLTSIPVLRKVERSRVLSFEPSPNSLPYLQRTRRRSGFQDRWEVVPKAAAESTGTVRFFVTTPRYGILDGLRDTGRASDGHTIEVPRTTVDAEWQRLGCPAVCCMKIDVEGAEGRVLKGAEQMVRRERPHILLEWSDVNLIPNGTDLSFLVRYAALNGYDVAEFPSRKPVSGLHDLERQTLDTQMYVLVPVR